MPSNITGYVNKMADEVLDLEVARQKMREWRDEPPRNSEEIIELGESLIVEHGSKLGDERKWEKSDRL